MNSYIVGIDVGVNRTRIGLFDKHVEKCVSSHHFLTDTEVSASELMDMLAQQVKDLVGKAGVSMTDVRGVGAAFPSYIDYEEGKTIETSNMLSLNDQPVRDMLKERLRCPVYVDNDGNVAALAEHQLGAGRGHDNMIYATLSAGIGGGLVINGKLYRGMHGMAGEIGHMLISDSTGFPCGCGMTGCVQSISSGLHMARYAMERIKEGEESRILDYAGTIDSIDTVAVGRALRVNDPLAIEVVNRGAEYLGRMFHSLNQIFDINVFVYGGGVTNLGPKFIDRMIEVYRRYTHLDNKYPAKFLPAELGDQVGLIGAALLVP